MVGVGDGVDSWTSGTSHADSAPRVASRSVSGVEKDSAFVQDLWQAFIAFFKPHELRMFAQAFRLLDPNESNCVCIKPSWLAHFLRIYNLSFSPSTASIQAAVVQCGASLDAITFEGMLIVVMVFVVEERRRNPRCLFGSGELHLLEKVYNRFSQSAVDGVRTKEIHAIWHELGREMDIDGREAQMKMRERILQVDVDLSGTIDWEEFLQLLRLYVEDQEQVHLASVLRGIRASRFSKTEVMLLQEVFVNESKSSDVTGSTVVGMLQTAGMVLDRSQKDIFYKCIARNAYDGRLAFESFLIVCRELQDAGFAGLLNIDDFCACVLNNNR